MRELLVLDLTLNNCSGRFKIDNGADGTVIPERIYKTPQLLPLLAESSKTLFGSAETALPVRGHVIGTIQRGERTLQQEIFVVTGAHQTVLGGPAIDALNLVEKGQRRKQKISKQSSQNSLTDPETSMGLPTQ